MARRRLNIRRHDHHYFHGWVVTIKRAGRRYQRYFSDGGNRDAAFTRALRWRDRLLRTLPPLRKFRRHDSQNKTGVIGVSRSVDVTRAGNLVPRYRAKWQSASGRIHGRSFSVLRYGERMAFALAVAERRRALARMLRPMGRRRAGGDGAGGSD